MTSLTLVPRVASIKVELALQEIGNGEVRLRAILPNGDGVTILKMGKDGTFSWNHAPENRLAKFGFQGQLDEGHGYRLKETDWV